MDGTVKELKKLDSEKSNMNEEYKSETTIGLDGLSHFLLTIE